MGGSDGRLAPRSWAFFWFLAGVLLVVGLTLLGGAVVAAQGRLIGGDDGADCVTNPTAVGATSPEDIRVSVTPSYWPLGTDCTLSSSSGQRMTLPETDWALTVVALTGLALVITPIALLPRPWRRV
ncbi:hypothetical protein [Curtobacterium sp. MCBA15_012]|uniref:hypothetical protein n=1 Tax=Curtobacterium sp. MCBA15_012 TaxID=1898738 RepID=UPI001113E776|nr:hypothetical protein [Curtobacterium sp. MCBA15_012]WIB00175.1 hypothetical protein QOL15_00365 [Curtobacterium sp. MCBA15_012]